MASGEPKPLALPAVKAAGEEPRPLALPKVQPTIMPKPLALKPVVTDAMAAQMTPTLALGGDEQFAILMGRYLDSIASAHVVGPDDGPFIRLLFQNGEVADIAPATLDRAGRRMNTSFSSLLSPAKIDKLLCNPVETITVEGIGQEPYKVPLRPPQPLKVEPPLPEPKPFIIGAHPRAAELLARAASLDSEVANQAAFRTRLELFLDLKPPFEWMNYGDRVVQPVVEAIHKTADFSNDISLAQAPKWADETRSAYQKGAGGFFAKKPEFYKGMLENARQILSRVAAQADAARMDLKSRLMALRVEELVFRVGTQDLDDPMQMQVADNRLRILQTALQNALQQVTLLESTCATVVKQIGDVDQLLTNIVPAWIAARSRA